MQPNELVKSDSEYENLNGTTDSRTGVPYPPANCSPTSTPSLLAEVNRQAERINTILAIFVQGRVVQESTLKVGIWPINYRLSGVSKTYNGAANEEVDDDATTYIYLDADNALVKNTTGFPADPAIYLPLAEVASENGSISLIVDRRPWLLYSVAEAGGTGPGAGDGLVSSGGNYHVGAGDGIQANADDVAVKLDATAGLEFYLGSLRVKCDETTLERVAAGLQIKNGAVTNLKLADGSVTSTKIVDGNVTSTKFADNAVTTTKIADGQVTDAKLDANAVTTTKLADNAVTTTKIADGQVTGAKLAGNSVDSSKLATLSVGTGHLVNGAVTSDKLAAGSVTASKIGMDIAGTGLIQNTTTGAIELSLNDTPGLEIYSYGLRVKCGNGLEINGSGQLFIDVDDISGGGLKNDGSERLMIRLIDPSGLEIYSNGLRVKAGHGLEINSSTYGLDIDVDDIVGEGLRNDGDNNLAILLYTSGGLEFSSGCLRVKSGDGLQVDGTTGELEVDVSDFAGAGLADDGSNKLKVNLSTAGGLEFSGTNLQVKAGNGIRIDGTTGQVQTYLYSTNPGLEFDGSALKVKSDEATIERGTAGLQIKNSGVTPVKLSDSIADYIPKAVLTVGAESSNQIEVGIRIKDIQDNNLSGRFLIHAWLSNYQCGPEASATPDATSWTDGTILKEETASRRWQVITSTSGSANLRITEDNSKYWYLNIEVNGRIYSSDSISFSD